jgi:hypothetical protein
MLLNLGDEPALPHSIQAKLGSAKDSKNLWVDLPF